MKETSTVCIGALFELSSTSPLENDTSFSTFHSKLNFFRSNLNSRNPLSSHKESRQIYVTCYKDFLTPSPITLKNLCNVSMSSLSPLCNTRKCYKDIFYENFRKSIFSQTQWTTVYGTPTAPQAKIFILIKSAAGEIFYTNQKRRGEILKKC